MVNRSPEAEVRAGAIILTEIEEPPASPPPQKTTPQRGLGLYLTGTDALDRFGGRPGSNDSLRTAQNLVKYLSCCGATAVVVPEALSDRAVRRSLFGQADEDSTGPDRLEMIRRILARQGFAASGSSWASKVRTHCRGCPPQTRPKPCAGDWSASTARAEPMGPLTIRSTRKFARR